jgi:hypothetical protein
MLLAATPAAQAWEPPPGMSTRQVLNDARKDADEGRLDAAAEKQLWFHEHALAREPAMSGVRLSFALADWAALARRHPPAMAQLLAVRDRAAARVDAGGRQGDQAMGEVTSINRYLNQPESTRDAFARFALRDPVLAERSALDVLPALIATNEFELAGRHLRVEAALARMEGLYKSLQQAPLRLSEADKAQMLRHHQRYIDLELARVVLVLARTQREAEAEQVVARGQALLGPDANTHHMAQALRGVTPPDDLAGS